MPAERVSLSDQINEFLPLVRKIAYHLVSRLPSFVLAEDLMQAGIIGLSEALQNYDDSKGASFSTYARIRIRGAMIDELRRGDWAPRSVHRATRSLNQAIAKVEAQSGRGYSLQEVALEMDTSIEEVCRILQDTHGKTIVSYDDIEFETERCASPIFGDPLSPLDSAQRFQVNVLLKEAIELLPEREKVVVMLYYLQDFSLKYIAEFLQISESRASQLMAEGLSKLRRILKNYEV